MKNETKAAIAVAFTALAFATASFGQTPPLPGGTNNPPTAEELAAQYAALVAAQQADYSNNYAPWLIPMVIGDGSPPMTSEAFMTQVAADLLTLSTNLAAMEAQQHAAVANLMLDQTPMPQTWADDNGNVYFFDHELQNGGAGIKVTHNLESAQTVSLNRSGRVAVLDSTSQAQTFCWHSGTVAMSERTIRNLPTAFVQICITGKPATAVKITRHTWPAQ